MILPSAPRPRAAGATPRLPTTPRSATGPTHSRAAQGEG
jgi:hypothetical protein